MLNLMNVHVCVHVVVREQALSATNALSAAKYFNQVNWCVLMLGFSVALQDVHAVHNALPTSVAA
jgi:hypothetical protein